MGVGENNKNERSYEEDLYPHSPDIAERETLDDGFSKGWGMHFPPLEKYWLDVHAHYWLNKQDDIPGLVKKYLRVAQQYNVRRIILMPPIPYLENHGKINYASLDDPYELNPHLTHACEDDNLAWMIYLQHTTPDAGFVEKTYNQGACCVKLHNAPLIMDGTDRRVFHSEAWYNTFATIEKLGIPVIWHITQRQSESPYTFGGKNAYWKIGWEKGIAYTNEDLLQDFLELVAKYPGIPFIAAHQLHMGWERLTELFDQFPNLYTDTSCVGFIREDDFMYEDDIRYNRDIFIKYSDRILFGTDIIMNEKNYSESYIRFAYKSHIRFIKQLRLPYDVLQKVSHENAERLFKM